MVYIKYRYLFIDWGTVIYNIVNDGVPSTKFQNHTHHGYTHLHLPKTLIPLPLSSPFPTTNLVL